MKRFIKNRSLSLIATLLATIVGAIGLVCSLLAYFGVELGLVLVPSMIFAGVAYRFHVKRLEQKSKEITEASRIYLATVEALATAIDARDQVDVGHVRRTQIYAVGIARLIGLSENEVDAIRAAALLHDIGKLAVPDHILNKPGELTPAELEKTKIHSRIGASILEKIGFECPVVATVKYHHESWDGTGYPERLKGDAIPLTARILSVADAFDSLRGARPYRPAMARDKAKEIIQTEAGKRFDPSIVNTLLRNLGSLEAEIDAQGLSYSTSGITTTGGETTHYVEQIKLANREVFSLYELAREFSSSENLDEMLDLFSKKITEFVPYETCALYLIDESKHWATASFAVGKNADLLKSRRIRVGQGATGFALKSGETVQNVEPDLDFAYSQTQLSGLYSTMAAVPLFDDNELIGAVTIYAVDLIKYGDEHIRLLETVSRIAAEAIGKSLRHDEARTHALTDPMTGLPNARSLQIQFDKEVGRASRGGTSFQLLMLDLDGFKTVNDSFGHKTGDEMLKQIGSVIRDQLREYDFLARYGGDEFVALLPETNPEDVADFCYRIEKAVADFALPVGAVSARVGISLGAAGYPESGETFDQMIVAADKAMYLRKTARKRAAQMMTPETNLSDDVLNASLIVEVDETHVISSQSLN